MKDGEQPHQRSAHVDHGLHDVGPDHGGQAAFKGIDQGQYGDDGDRRNLPSAQRDGHHDGNGIYAHAFGRGARDQKKAGGQGSQPRPKRRSISS